MTTMQINNLFDIIFNLKQINVQINFIKDNKKTLQSIRLDFLHLPKIEIHNPNDFIQLILDELEKQKNVLEEQFKRETEKPITKM
jgi:hypothetical protein